MYPNPSLCSTNWSDLSNKMSLYSSQRFFLSKIPLYILDSHSNTATTLSWCTNKNMIFIDRIQFYFFFCFPTHVESLFYQNYLATLLQHQLDVINYYWLVAFWLQLIALTFSMTSYSLFAAPCFVTLNHLWVHKFVIKLV